LLLDQLAEQRRQQAEALDLLAMTFRQSLQITAEANSKIAEAVSKQAGFFDTWLSLFKTNSAPEARIVRDADEYEAEQARKRSDWTEQQSLKPDELLHGLDGLVS